MTNEINTRFYLKLAQIVEVKKNENIAEDYLLGSELGDLLIKSNSKIDLSEIAHIDYKVAF